MSVSLSPTRIRFDKEVSKLETILKGFQDIPVNFQYLISEVILIRVASLLEFGIAEVSYKIASGSLYLDGSVPKIIVPCRSMQAARTAMLLHGRKSPKNHLKWSRSKFIREAVENVIDPQDHFVITCTNFGAIISEIFKVRNFAAHRTTSSKTEFREVVKTIYGRERKVQLGYFLLTENYVSVPNLTRYLIESRVVINELTRF